MIIKGFLAIVAGIISGLNSLLPDVSLPGNLADAAATASNYLANMDQFFPVSTLLAVLFLVLVVEGTILIYKLIRWIYNKIPGIN